MSKEPVSKEPTSKESLIKDCIYGHIEIPQLCKPFIDTPEFQRLRRVKQLGSAYYAYPSATHTRFEHCIGVMHLAGFMVDKLRKYRNITDRQKELIQLGGLYHDIGHFSYSHLFDVFLKKRTGENEEEQNALEGNRDPIFEMVDHEDRSIYYLGQVNKRKNLLTTEEELFVIDVIKGNERHREKYLYQIVCNKRCGIDVDKMDYLRRDSYHCGMPEFQSEFIIRNSQIDKDNNICFKSKIKSDISDLFAARHRMFKTVYQHHTSMKIDKIKYCMFVRLGEEIYKHGADTCDYSMEMLLRTSRETKGMMADIDNRQLNHDCPICSKFDLSGKVKKSGTIEDVIFAD